MKKTPVWGFIVGFLAGVLLLLTGLVSVLSGHGRPGLLEIGLMSVFGIIWGLVLGGAGAGIGFLIDKCRE